MICAETLTWTPPRSRLFLITWRKWPPNKMGLWTRQILGPRIAQSFKNINNQLSLKHYKGDSVVKQWWEINCIFISYILSYRPMQHTYILHNILWREEDIQTTRFNSWKTLSQIFSAVCTTARFMLFGGPLREESLWRSIVLEGLLRSLRSP